MTAEMENVYLEITAWVFGILAMLSLFLAYQQNARKKLLTRKLCADICWVIHYWCLGGYGGLIPNAVGVFRELVFVQRDKHKLANNPFIPVIFILINFSLGMLTFEKPINLLPIVASSLVTVSLWLRNPKLTKIIVIPVSLSYWIYNFFIGSWIGVINESIAIASIIISFVKDRRSRT